MVSALMKRSEMQFIFKASWRGTALNLIIHAKDEDEAFLKAARKVKRMLGGATCLDLVLVREGD